MALGGMAYDVEHSRIVALPNGNVTTTAYSTDGGATWTTGGTVTAKAGGYGMLAYDPLHKVLVGGNNTDNTTVRSTDGGVTWTAGGAMGSGAPTLRQGMWDPATNRVIAPSAGTSTVYITEDGGLTWVAVTSSATMGYGFTIVTT